jgi:hypothetical protein
MRTATIITMFITLLLATGCEDVSGIGGGRSLSGVWSASVDREDIFVTLTEDRGQIHGSGSWGYDAVTVVGNRAGADVSLVFEFYDFNPINFQGSLAHNRIDGWLTGSGFRGESATFWRD